MGAKKQWTGKEKLAIVLQGLKGDCSVSGLCNDHGITQGMYYKGLRKDENFNKKPEVAAS